MILLAVIVGAVIALFSYHMGRNNKIPLPDMHMPSFFRVHNPDNGEAPEPARTRGM